MLNWSFPCVISRILDLNKFHKPPEIMTQSSKNELIKLLATEKERQNSHYNIKAQILRDDLPQSDIGKWEIQILPNSISLIHLDSVIQHIQEIEEHISMYLDHVGHWGISLM